MTKRTERGAPLPQCDDWRNSLEPDRAEIVGIDWRELRLEQIAQLFEEGRIAIPIPIPTRPLEPLLSGPIEWLGDGRVSIPISAGHANTNPSHGATTILPFRDAEGTVVRPNCRCVIELTPDPE